MSLLHVCAVVQCSNGGDVRGGREGGREGGWE